MRSRDTRLAGCLGRRHAAWLMLGLSLVAAPAGAAAIKLSSTRIALSAETPIVPVTVHNEGTEPVMMQAQIFDWSQPAGEDVLQPTREVLANPLQFKLAPGGDQILRFGLHVGASPSERSYRVLIQQLPDDVQAGGQIQTLLRLSVPIFVAPPTAGTGARPAPPRLDWKILAGHDQPQLEVVNHGPLHVELIHLTLSVPGGQALLDRGLSFYVLPGQTRHLPLPKGVIAPGQAVQLSAKTDQQDDAVQASLSAAGE